ncbi:MAG: DUF1854 domain-containing protein [Clostridia bacterium]|jgi:hypothetical protein|nr:DUF1854 domain-containing protein [Clostridia bacterium]MBQ3928329.1 DUF1854 domain-containing protein [Clostridia bacterium]
MEEVELESLFERRESVRLTQENAVFSKSPGGLISLTLRHPESDKPDEFFERVIPLRGFPITDPEQFISIREPDTKEKGRGAEIGLIYDMKEFDQATQELIRAELDRHYFTPELLKIYSVKEKFGYLYFEAETSAGPTSFVLNNPYSNFRTFDDERIFIYDIDGNCFQISHPEKLDKASYRRIEIYL